MNAVTILHDLFGADRRYEKNWGFAALDFAVISHRHGDHTSGLGYRA